MKTKYISIIIFTLLINCSQAQGFYVLGKVNLEVQSNSHLNIEGKGNITFAENNGQSGNYGISGIILISGNWYNNMSNILDLSSESGQIIFNGIDSQIIGGNNSTNFASIKLDNDVNLSTDVGVSENLNFYNGSIFIGNSNLTLLDGVSLTNYNSQNNIITNGTGDVKQYVEAGGSQVVFPVATQTSYTPVFITQNSGNSGFFNVRLMDGVWSEGTTGSNLALVEPTVNRTWIIDADVQPIADIQLQWNQSDELNGFDRFSALGAKYVDGWFQQITSISGSDPYLVSFSNVTNLYTDEPHSLSDQTDPLEIKLISFVAEWENENKIVRWASASEYNSVYYELSSSTDLQNWNLINTIPSNISSYQVLNYSFIDTQNYKAPIVYYKLEIIDIQNNRTFLSHTFLKLNQNSLGSFIYLDQQSNINLRIFESGQFQYQIYNITGKIIQEDLRYLNSGEVFHINKTSLSAGIYILKLVDLRSGQFEKFKIQIP